MVERSDPTRFHLLQLKPREEKRLLAGHLWVYSNEVDNRKTPLKRFKPGQPVMIVSASSRVIGTGYVNPNSLICARLVTRSLETALDGVLIRQRLGQALALRQAIYPEPYYRLCFGESDGLPGLVLDRFGQYCSGQITTAGMQRFQAEIESALDELLQPRSLIWRNDVAVRQLEGLPAENELVFGQMPDEVEVHEAGLVFRTSLTQGQKTGWFYDQTANRYRLGKYVAGADVADLYSYLGGWGLRAAQAGAQSVVCVDSSPAAVAGVQRAAEDNQLNDRVKACQKDVQAWMQEAADAGRQYDVVVLDPPALIKRKRDQRDGQRAYQRLNELALRIVRPGGVLFSFSCSQHLSRDELRKTINRAGMRQGIPLQVLENLQQGPDHPVHPAMVETEYLKGFVIRRLAC